MIQKVNWRGRGGDGHTHQHKRTQLPTPGSRRGDRKGTVILVLFLKTDSRGLILLVALFSPFSSPEETEMC